LDLLFLIPSETYLAHEALLAKLKPGDVKRLGENNYLVREVKRKPASLFGSISLSDLSTSMETRANTTGSSTLPVSPWDLDDDCTQQRTGTHSWPQTPMLRGKIRRSLNHAFNKHREIFAPFFAAVDKEQYQDYLSFVPVEMNFQSILERLESSFYASSGQLKKDIQTVVRNAHLYNPEGSDILLFADQFLMLLGVVGQFEEEPERGKTGRWKNNLIASMDEEPKSTRTGDHIRETSPVQLRRRLRMEAQAPEQRHGESSDEDMLTFARRKRIKD